MASDDMIYNNLQGLLLTCQSITNRNMIWLPIWLFLALFANAKLESEFSNVEPRALNNASQETLGNSEQNSKNDGEECDPESLNDIVCENDRLKFCGPNNQIMSVRCAVNGRQGFCNCEKTGCVANKPICPEETTCSQSNTKLPDNLDCHKFSYCNEDSRKITLRCPGNLVYNMTAEKCTDHARCTRVVCPRPGNTPQLVPFPQAKNYYVLCYKGMGEVGKCSDKYYAVQNNMCQFDCSLRKETGLFRDSNLQRCRRGYFYACSRSGTNFRTEQVKCKTGLTFDERLGMCTSEENCKDTPAEGI